MTIRLSWPSQASKGLTAIEIYRKEGWNATIDVYNPGTPHATLSGSAVEFVDNIDTLTKNTTYRYWVAAVKDNERLIGNPITQGFYPDTGPGPQTILRGDWASGYFGTVSNTEFFNTAELKLMLTAQQGNMFTYDPQEWHKFIFRGRIVFFPATMHSKSNSVQMAYQYGMMYGTDDVGSIVPQGATATKQDCKVTKDGRTYRIRLPYAVPYDAALSGQDYNNGEWRNTMGRLYPVGAQYAALGLGAIDSLERQGATAQPNESGAAVLAPLLSNNIFAYAYGTVPMGISNTAGVGNSATIFFAFELVLP
ncbi:glycosyl hydrolase [Proteus phage 7]|uniref:Glycosyl hydrolase n=1 Tax=Proteus phage 7 TaxID=2767546 RepID=A0A7G9UU61_9CAUD|nr:glycosyl hydrolase [Proteus phage 7]